MSYGKNNALIVAAALAVAALVCLGVGLRLLSATGSGDALPGSPDSLRLVSVLAIGGGLVIFLLGTIVLLAARRMALGATRTPDDLPANLGLVDIREWSRELADIRDHLRQDPGPDDPPATISVQELTVPDSWRAQGRYLLGPDGRSTAPHTDLGRTRDQLLTAAERVDAIVKNINDITSNISPKTTCSQNGSRWKLWRIRLRR